MLVPYEQTVGNNYNAGLTATAYAQQPDQSAGGGWTSPSGRPIGGLKLGVDVAQRMVATAQAGRYRQAGPALGAASESGYVQKDASVPYLTEAEQAARGGWERVKAGWANESCRPLALAVLVGAWLLFRRG